MSFKQLIPVLGAAALLMSACVPFAPYDPDKPNTEPQVAGPEDAALVTSEEQQQLRDARDQVASRSSTTTTDPDPPSSTTSTSGGGAETSTGGADYRRAIPIPGKEGFVFNPFTNNPVDVRGIPSGSLVFDPQDPNKDKHHFRVP